MNAQGGKYVNALQAGSNKDHKEIILLLLEGRVDVNAQGGHYGNALQVASNNGYKKIVKLLLEKEADVTQCTGRVLWKCSLSSKLHPIMVIRRLFSCCLKEE